jgi:hypothetical protein
MTSYKYHIILILNELRNICNNFGGSAGWSLGDARLQLREIRIYLNEVKTKCASVAH